MKIIPGHPLMEHLDRLLGDVALLPLADLAAIERWLDHAAQTANQIPDDWQRFAWGARYADALARRIGCSLSCAGALLQARMGRPLAPADSLNPDHSRCS